MVGRNGLAQIRFPATGLGQDSGYITSTDPVTGAVVETPVGPHGTSTITWGVPGGTADTGGITGSGGGGGGGGSGSGAGGQPGGCDPNSFLGKLFGCGPGGQLPTNLIWWVVRYWSS